jgi:hypothetical protein
MVRRFGDDLRGPIWDQVRDARRGVIGNAGVELSEDAVPPSLRHLLAFASLLSTGEEGALLRFWRVMDSKTRDQWMEAVSPWVDELRDFGLARSGASVPLSPAIVPGPDAAVHERLKGLMAAVAAEVKSTSAEQHAMLDLARMHDLVVRDWEEGKLR